MIEDVYNIAECPHHGSYIENADGCPRCPQKPKTGQNSDLAIASGVSSAKGAKMVLLSYSQYMAQYKRSSKTEYDRYCYLYACLQDGTISKLKCQPHFELLAGMRPTANILRPKPAKQIAIGYTADFEYYYQGIWVIEDVKGKYGNSAKNKKKGIAGKPIINAESKLRHKMLQAMYPDMVFKIVTNTSEAIRELQEDAA